MVFVNLDKGKPKQQASPYGVQYKCINCRKPIDYPAGSIYARRFCSSKCEVEYFQPKS